MKLSGLNIFREYAKKRKLNLVLVVVLVLKSKALYCLCAIYARKFYLRSHVNITTLEIHPYSVLKKKFLT